MIIAVASVGTVYNELTDNFATICTLLSHHHFASHLAAAMPCILSVEITFFSIYSWLDTRRVLTILVNVGEAKREPVWKEVTARQLPESLLGLVRVCC